MVFEYAEHDFLVCLACLCFVSFSYYVTRYSKLYIIIRKLFEFRSHRKFSSP